MKLIYRIMVTAIMVLMAARSMQAQDAVYVVGNLTSWKEPSAANSDYYADYQMQKDGTDKAGNIIWHADFDISTLNEEPLFRFYTGLDGWEVNSLGSQLTDAPIDYSVSEANNGLTVVDGKGSFRITGWSGDHIYITLCGNRMTASSTGYVDPKPGPYITIPEYDTGIDLMNCINNPGCYYVSLPYDYQYYTGENMVSAVFSIPGYLAGSPEKDFVYINPAESLKADECGIAQSSFTFSDTPAEVRFIDLFCDWSASYIYLDLNKNKLYLNRGSSRWVWVNRDSRPAITFDNYKEFEDCRLDGPSMKNFLTEIPAQVSLYIYYTTPSLFNIENYWLDMWYLDNTHSKWIHTSNSLPIFEDVTVVSEWPGGYLVANWEGIGYIESMEKIYVKYRNTEQIIELEKSKENPSVYTGVVNFEPASRQHLVICFTGKSISPVPGLWIPGLTDIIFSGKDDSVVMDYNIRSSADEISLDQFSNGGELQVSVNTANATVELKALTADLDIIPIYRQHTINSYNGEEFDYNQSMYRFGSEGEDMVYGSSINYSMPELSLKVENYLTLSNGDNIIFDYSNPFKEVNGIKYYHYTASADQPATKFELNKSDKGWPDYAVANIYDKTQELLIYESASSFTDYVYLDKQPAPKSFYVDANSYNVISGNVFEETKDCLGLSRFQNSPRLEMVKADPAAQTYVYEGTFSIPDNETIDFISIYFGVIPSVYAYPYYGFSMYTGQNIAENPVLETSGWMMYYPSYIYLDNVSKVSRDYAVRITLEKDGNVILWLGNGEAGKDGVVEIGVTEDVFRVRTAPGSINIESSADRHVDIYSITGMLIRSIDISAGLTCINGFTPGVYIVNGQKL
ncbi:MAG: hypothetical protein K2J15_00230, partial [Muribaculaceae bacterium]|nr:hypothetical protein [Muribaculaceae bacterium]